MASASRSGRAAALIAYSGALQFWQATGPASSICQSASRTPCELDAMAKDDDHGILLASNGRSPPGKRR
jgi:hypothetical protein